MKPVALLYKNCSFKYNGRAVLCGALCDFGFLRVLAYKFCGIENALRCQIGTQLNSRVGKVDLIVANIFIKILYNRGIKIVYDNSALFKQGDKAIVIALDILVFIVFIIYAYRSSGGKYKHVVAG